MPEWPGVGRADDHRLLEALRRGDGHASAALYDAYADRLSDYAYALVRDLDAAARAVHDALVAASACADRLKEPARLRAWLYALTRFYCLAQSHGSSHGASHGASRGRAAGGARNTGPVIAVEESADPPLAALLQEALDELGGNEREVLALAVRHGLTPAEIGSVLGLASRQVSARLTRGRDHLENAAAALVLARVGRAHCPDLSALVDHGVGASWQDGPLGTPLRKRLSRHVAACEICREGRGRHVSAGRLLDLVPVAFPPLSLRRQVIESSLRAAGRGEHPAAACLDRRGFPVPGGRRRAGTAVADAVTQERTRERTPAALVTVAGWETGERPRHGGPAAPEQRARAQEQRARAQEQRARAQEQRARAQEQRARAQDQGQAQEQEQGRAPAREPGRRARRRGRGRPRSLRVAPVLLAAACVFGTAGGLALVSGEAPAEHLEAVRIPPTTAAPGGLALGPEESDPPNDDEPVDGEPVDGETPGPAPTPPHGPSESAATAPPPPPPPRGGPARSHPPHPEAVADRPVPRRPRHVPRRERHAGRAGRRGRVDGPDVRRHPGDPAARQAPRGRQRPGHPRRRRTRRPRQRRGDVPLGGGPPLVPDVLGRPGGRRRRRPRPRSDHAPDHETDHETHGADRRSHRTAHRRAVLGRGSRGHALPVMSLSTVPTL